MSFTSEYLEKYKQISKKLEEISDELTKEIYLISSINSFLESNGIERIIIVGGLAVELYIRGACRTADIDLIVEGY